MTAKPTLYSFVLLLAPTEHVVVGATAGHQAHAAFLHTIEEVDPTLSALLHAPGVSTRPFTVSPLRGLGRPRAGQVQLAPGRECWLRFTALDPAIYQRFMARFLSGAAPVLRLGPAAFLVKEIRTTPGSHPWAGYSSWWELADRAGPEPEVALRFCSPTAFGFGQHAWGKKIAVLPDPVPVFSSLLRAWNNLAPPALQMDRGPLLAYLEEHVVIKRLERLRTEMLHYARSPQVGFVGEATYGLMADDEDARLQLNTLAAFAFYAGVGMKTTMGMGQVRRLSDAR